MRYVRQESILGKTSQKKTVTIVGVGALGTFASSLLARAGVNLILIDQDIVQLDNLQRQILYDEKDINELKAKVAIKKLKKINSNITIKSHATHLDDNNSKILKSDLILDCTDNFETRRVINRYSKKTNISWIHAAATGVIGNVLFVDSNICFDCVYKSNINKNCDNEGVLNSLIAIVSSVQITQALKFLNNKEYSQNLIHINIWNNGITEIKVKKEKKCNHSEIISDENYKIEKCLSKNTYKTKPLKKTSLNFKELRKKFKIKLDANIVLIINYNNSEIIVHKYGEIEFKKNIGLNEIKKISNLIYFL